ncbi:UNVERIFIED_CONTAM: SAG-related sequence SRS22B [Hammondia hammondi]|eukprot:XP_008887541.1 SAG-related sequence SRS22B [Hammondia hammondi]
MKFSLLTLGALALSAQQACAMQARDDSSDAQQGDSVPETCSDSPLSFNITEAGQSVVFKCGDSVNNLDPAVEEDQKMYKGTEAVSIISLLPGATLKAVDATPVEQSRQKDATGSTFNFTVPILPNEEQDLHVNCTASDAGAKSDDPKNCTVSFHIVSSSSAVRPLMAASAVVSFIVSLLHFD